MNGRYGAVSVRSIRVAIALLGLWPLALVGCQESRQVVAVDPVLYGWSEPYQGVPGLRVHAFNTGSMQVLAAAAFRGGSWLATRQFDNPAFVIEHPVVGLVVFDAGFSSKVESEGVGYTGIVSGALLRARMSAEGDLAGQMQTAGLDPDEVEYVVLSHLHWDHTGGAGAFPRATIVTGLGEKEQALAAWGPLALYHLEELVAASRWLEVDYSAGEPFATFAAHHDLIGDGSIVLLDLRGHTEGSQGVLVRTERAPVLLTGDAVWVEQNWRWAAMPIWAHDRDVWWQQIWRVKKLAQLVPATLIVPGHDLGILRRIEHPAVVLHEGPARAVEQTASLAR